MNSGFVREDKRRDRDLRLKIYSTAMRLFNEGSYYDVTVKDICRESGVALGTFYSFFPSKEQIITEYGSASDAYFEDITENLKGETAAEKLRNLIELCMVIIMSGTLEIHQMILECMIRRGTWYIFRPEGKLSQLLRSLINEGVCGGEFREGIRIDTCASQIINGLMGIALKRCASPEQSGAGEACTFTDFVLDMLSALH